MCVCVCCKLEHIKSLNSTDVVMIITRIWSAVFNDICFANTLYIQGVPGGMCQT